MARWNIRRGIHYEVLAIARIDNTIVTVSLFMATFFSLYKPILEHKLHTYIKYWYPIILVVNIALV